MGKKKSMVLMTLLTVVIVVLCAVTVFPSFPISNTVKKWNPAIMQYDLGKDFGGGYYTYYYPEGVYSETEYENNYAMMEEEDKQEYADSYFQHGGLYLDKDEDKNLVAVVDGKETVDPDFAETVAKAADVIAKRFSAVGYSDFRVAVVDDCAIRIETPASDSIVSQTLSLFAKTDDMTIVKGGETIEELKSKETSVSDLVKGFSVVNRSGVSYLEVKFTKAGKAMIKNVKSGLSKAAETTDQSSATTLDIKIDDATAIAIFQDYIDDTNNARVPLQYEENKVQVEVLKILFSSTLKNGDLDVTFRSIASSDIRSFEAVGGKNVLTATYIALAIAIVAICVVSVLKMGRFGVVNIYSVLSYIIVTGLCYGFISKAVFEITFGSILIFAIGLALTCAINAYIYKAIKKEFLAGKTVVSAVKGGYTKTLGGVIDVYAVALLAAIAMLIAVAGLFTMALQALICLVTAAFCNLLWARAINYVFLSASKDKYKYFRFVREEDDDDE